MASEVTRPDASTTEDAVSDQSDQGQSEQGQSEQGQSSQAQSGQGQSEQGQSDQGRFGGTPTDIVDPVRTGRDALTPAGTHLLRIGRWIRRHAPAATGVLLVALVGGVLGAELAPATNTTIGPLQAKVRVVPSLQPGVHLLLPPAGQVDFATHVAPVALEGEISQVDLEGARTLINSPAQVRALGDSAGVALRGAAIRATLTTIGFALIGALGLSFLVYRRRWRRSAQVALTLVGSLVLTAGLAGVTADPQRLAQPKFTGLLSQAPYIAGQVPSVLQRLETYRSGLADIVRSVTALYATTGGLSELSTTDDDEVITVLHVSDIHLNPLAFDLIDRLVAQFGVDAVIDTGDITTWGTEVESSTFSRIAKLPVPYVFVRGNHDSLRTEAAVRQFKNAVVLDDEVAEVAGLVIAGIGDPAFTPESSQNNQSDLPGPTAPPIGATSSAPGAPSTAADPSRTRIWPPQGLWPTVSASTVSAPTVSASTVSAPTVSASTVSASTVSAPPTSTSPSPGAGAGPGVVGPAGPQGASNTRLAAAVDAWNAAHVARPVQIAAVHEPYQLQPLLGLVPTVMAGHTHSRTMRLDSSGTRVLIEGSTGGAGITSRGLIKLADGEPLPLAASLVYYARRGPRAGQIVATDAITVGGFGLTSVNLERTVVPPPTAPLKRPVQAAP
jgi:calcineurin-like phosphoesterase family protein